MTCIYDRLKIMPRFLGSYLFGRSLELADTAMAEPTSTPRGALQAVCLAHWRAGVRILKSDGEAERAPSGEEEGARQRRSL